MKIRRARSVASPEVSAAARSEDPATEIKPMDALTVVKGIVARIPEVLEGSDLGEAAPADLNKAVRQAVRDEFQTRAQFAGRLAEIDAMLWAQQGRSDATPSGTMTTHLRDLRILRFTEPEENERFVVTEGEGTAFELLRPAYVDELTGKIILSGQLRRVEGPSNASPEEGR